MKRISYIIRIYKSLQIYYSVESVGSKINEEAADDWIKLPGVASIYNGGSALDKMLSGNIADLDETARYLDSQIYSVEYT